MGQAAEATGTVRLPVPCLVVLIGPSGSGKSRWAAANFDATQVVSSDGLRALVGEGEHDQRAGRDAFEVLDLVLERRLARGLVTVVDTLGLDDARRRAHVALARRLGVRCHAVVFDTPAPVCRARNRARPHPVPARALSGQLRSLERVVASLGAEGFDGVHAPGAVELTSGQLLRAPAFRSRQRDSPLPLRFGLQVPSFSWSSTPAELAGGLARIARDAEAAGFSSLWVMDHFLQIPQVGREWEPMPESYTTLGFLAGQTSSIRLGTLVTGISYRNIAHLAKLVATLDVLSGGRALCGLGAAWYRREHLAYGWRFPPLRERFAMLEDALRLLPLMWGPGSPAFEGTTIRVPAATCYPRPVQERIPILVGGGGERRTLRLVAEHADACNLFGDAAAVRHKLGVLAQHCEAVGRRVNEVEVTHLSTTLVAADRAALERAIEAGRPRAATAAAHAARVNAGTVDEQIGRFRELAEAGVQTAIVSLPNVGDESALSCFGEVVSAFPDPPAV